MRLPNLRKKYVSCAFLRVKNDNGKMKISWIFSLPLIKNSILLQIWVFFFLHQNPSKCAVNNDLEQSIVKYIEQGFSGHE